MAIYAKHKESGLYICDHGNFISFVADISQATDVSESADILADSEDIELVKI